MKCFPEIKDDFLVFLFVGRLKKEKGIFELVKAFKNLIKENDKIVLIIVGPDEDEVKKKLFLDIEKFKDVIRWVDFTKTPEIYMAASDIFVLPSYREGFGSVIIEAAACGLPTIGSNIYGISDAIIDGKTGLLFPVKSSGELEVAMLELITNKELRIQLGIEAMDRANNYFSQDDITSKVLDLYKDMLKL